MKMNPFPRRATNPACRPFVSLLPLLHAGELTEEQEAALRAHLASCDRCQRELAAYDTVEAATRLHFGELNAPLFASMEELIERAEPNDRPITLAGEEPLEPLPKPAAPTPLAPLSRRGPRRLLTWISVVAAALLLIVIIAGLVISHPPAIGKRALPIAAAPASVYLTPTGDQTTNTELMALNASDGSARWRYNSGVAEVAPILQDGVLYMGSSDYSTSSSHGTLYAFRASDGAVLWQHQMLQEITKLEVSDGIVYATAEQGGQAATYAYRASDGALLWRFDQGTLRAVANGLVYIGGYQAYTSMDTPLYAVNASDGSITWQRPGSGPNTFTIWFVYPAAGILYVIAGSISNGGPLPVTLVALNPSTGKQLWSHPSIGGFVAAESRVAVVTGKLGGFPAIPLPPSEVYGLNAANGSVQWQFQLPAPIHLTGGTSDNGVFYLGATDNTLSAIDANSGRTLWHVTLGAAGEPSLAADGLLIVSAYNYYLDNTVVSAWPSGRLEVHNASDGALKWTYQAPNTSARVEVKALINGALYTTTIDPNDPQDTRDPVTGNPLQHTVLSAFNASDGTVKWHYDLGTNPYEFLTIG